MRDDELGATGKFPQGKLNETDEGELQFGVAHDDQFVHVNFGKPIAWFALGPDDAVALGALLTHHAKMITEGKP